MVVVVSARFFFSRSRLFVFFFYIYVCMCVYVCVRVKFNDFLLFGKRACEKKKKIERKKK